jgi:hypothetical protein
MSGTYTLALIMIYLLGKGRHYRACRPDNQFFADFSLVLVITFFLFTLTRAPVDGGEEGRHEVGCDLTSIERSLNFSLRVLNIHHTSLQGILTLCLDHHFEI